MVFSSNVFLLYFLPLFLICYFAFPKSCRNIVLLLSSVLFYAYGAPDFVLLLIGSTVANFYLVKAMSGTGKPGLKKIYCAIAISVSMGLLAYYKYANFFVDNFNCLLSAFGVAPIVIRKILLPIGISFFSFQSVTYVVDTYRGISEPMKRLSDYVLYIMMFPQLIAGPIVRYCDIKDQINNRKYDVSECLHGIYRFIIGLSKKVLVADVVGIQADKYFAGDLSVIDAGTAWIAIVAYTMQLYFDFSGYSDMAIGLGKIIGFRFPENFDNPYNSSSVSEFWRRWHITLGTFMRNYLYIPLGGNRCAKSRMYFNLWVTFLLSGLWHGASWNFVAWGAYHGFWLVTERIGFSKILTKAGKLPSVLFTFIVVLVGWVIFRTENLADAWTFITRLFSFDFNGFSLSASKQFYAILLVALMFSFIALSSIGKKLQDKIFYAEYSTAGHIIAWIVSAFMFLFILGALNAVGFSPFIYFRF